jgi:hypothetical protein
MTAYTTVSLMSKSTGRMLSLKDVNHCICPGQSSNYDLVDSQFEDVDDETESMSTTYVCNPVIIKMFSHNKYNNSKPNYYHFHGGASSNNNIGNNLPEQHNVMYI